MNFNQLLKQAQEMQRQMMEVQAQLGEKEVTGTAGGGLVTVTLNGKGELRKLTIDPSLVVPEEVEILEDILKAAFNEAKSKIDQYMAESMGNISSGMKLPGGFKLPF